MSHVRVMRAEPQSISDAIFSPSSEPCLPSASFFSLPTLAFMFIYFPSKTPTKMHNEIT